jgi:hypothetical protein
MCGLIPTLILGIALTATTYPTPPSWVGPLIDGAGVLLVATGAIFGWSITAPYWVTASSVAVWTSIFLYLGHDESPTDGFALPEPSSREVEAYDLLLWLSKEGTPQSRVSELNPVAQDDLFASLPSDDTELQAHVRQHAVSIRAAWEADTLGREWIERMARAGAIAEPSSAPEAPIVDFRPTRKVINLRLAYALLLAEEGDTEGAYNTLAPTVRFAHQLSAARILVHAMIGTVVTKQTYRVMRITMPQLSTRQRHMAAALLDEVQPVHARIYSVFAGDIAFARACLLNVDWSKDTGIQSIIVKRLQVWRLFFHPERTLNKQRALYELMLPSVLDKDFEKADSYARAFVTGPFPRRNLLGTLTQRMMLPALDKMFREIWRVEDQRSALVMDLNPAPSP